MKKLILLLYAFFFLHTQAQQATTLPKGFVYITDHIPHIQIDLKYCGSHNFIGRPIDGYLFPKAIFTQKATIALAQVEKELNKQGLGLKIFDAYRPQAAVNHFKRWAQDIDDTLMRSEFYPSIDKRMLFKQGYIASKSGHSRGSTIDLTIIDLKSNKELDMGTAFDFFGDKSGHDYPHLTTIQTKNRKLLKSLMSKHGFRPYSKEWWHYTLNNEPFKETYYNFQVK